MGKERDKKGDILFRLFFRSTFLNTGEILFSSPCPSPGRAARKRGRKEAPFYDVGAPVSKKEAEFIVLITLDRARVPFLFFRPGEEENRCPPEWHRKRGGEGR